MTSTTRVGSLGPHGRCGESGERGLRDRGLDPRLQGPQGAPSASRSLGSSRPSPMCLLTISRPLRRLHPKIRPGFGYRSSLELLAWAKELRSEQVTKSNLIVGMGETEAEVYEAMDDLRTRQAATSSRSVSTCSRACPGTCRSIAGSTPTNSLATRRTARTSSTSRGSSPAPWCARAITPGSNTGGPRPASLRRMVVNGAAAHT